MPLEEGNQSNMESARARFKRERWQRARNERIGLESPSIEQSQAPTDLPATPPMTFGLSKRYAARSLILIAVCLLISGIVISLHSAKSSATQLSTTQPYATATAQAVLAHDSYLSSLSESSKKAFVDPLSQESGSQWGSSRTNSTGGSCLFAGGAYHVNQEADHYFMDCLASGTFSNFAFEVQLTITQGDCGGMVFRRNNNGHFYFFTICQNGRYRVVRYVSNSASNAIVLRSKSSAAINPGLGQPNKIAVVADGGTMTFYVNEQQIDREQDDSYASGSIGLVADPLYNDATDVAYTNARLWTR